MVTETAFPWGTLVDVEYLADEGTSYDAHRKRVPDWKVVATSRAVVRDQSRREITRGAETVIVDGRLWEPDPDRVPSAFGRVRALGRTYNVVGEPYVARDGRGPHHVEVDLQYVSGTT